MKNKLLNALAALILLLTPTAIFAQAPPLGTAANFVLFTTIGAVTNSGIPYLAHITGNVGTNSAPTITGFGNVNGQMHFVSDPASAQCATDLQTAYDSLSAAIPDSTLGAVIGNGDTLKAGVYSIPSAATLNLALTLDAKGDSNAIFIFKILGAFSTNANSKIKLINGALACNVFWQIETWVSMASGTTMRGTIVSGGAITMNSGDTLEGRALTISGQILLVDGVLAYTPVGCGSPVHTGPIAPALASTACYALFTSNGALTDNGQTFVNGGGSIGNNITAGGTTGFDPLKLTGGQHSGDGSTAQCKTDLDTLYKNLNLLPYNIELLQPTLFGHDLVLTPHTYIMKSAVTFTDTLYLNAEGDTNAVFVIQVNGALATSTHSKVILINGTRAKNVYWKIDGAVGINDYSIFNGTIVAYGAINLQTGVVLNGRALTVSGAFNTYAMTVNLTSGCGNFPANITVQPVSQTACKGSLAVFSVTATGLGLTYQWRNGTSDITGAISSTITINPVSTSDVSLNYNVVVSGTNPPDVISENVSLTLNTAVGITKQPISQTACNGGSAGFSVTATGTGLTYQWRNGTSDITGAISATLTINPVSTSDVSLSYNVVVSGTCSPSAVSQNVSLALDTAVNITTQPVSQTACAGDAASFSVAAIGTGLTYQWRKGISNITGATSATLAINPVSISDAASNYNVVTKGTCTNNATSPNVSLVVNSAPNITTQPVTQTTIVGDSVSFSVVATGTGLTYQWRNGNVDIINIGKFSGASSDMLIINPVNMLDVSSNYNVVIYGGACEPNDTSASVSLVVNVTGIASLTGNTNKAVTIYPNPFSTYFTIVINDESQINNCVLKIYNVLGKEVVNTTIIKQLTVIGASNFPSGIYFYEMIGNNKIIQSGKLISQ